MAAPDMAEVYRSLVGDLKDKFGGTIDDDNAEAIALAAAQVYRREVEPRLWEDRSAHELLDSFGVPRTGDFIPYSLRDRLLLLQQRNGQRSWVEQAHELLDELGVPRQDSEGLSYPLRTRLNRLLDNLENLDVTPPGTPDESGEARTTTAGEHEQDATSKDGPTTEATQAPGPGSDAADTKDGNAAAADTKDGNRQGDTKDGAVTAPPAGSGVDDHRGDGSSAPEGGGEVVGPELVDALQAIQRATGHTGEEQQALQAPPPEPSGLDLAGLGSVLGTMQGELVELRQAVEALRAELHDAITVFTGGTPAVPVVPAPSSGPEGDGSPATAPGPEGKGSTGRLPAVVPDDLTGTTPPVSVDDEASPKPFAPAEDGSGPGSPASAGDGSGPMPSVTARDGSGPVPSAGADDPTRPTPPVEASGAAEEQESGRHRSRGVAHLVLLILLIGLVLAGGVTAAVVLGWDELRSRFSDFISPVAARLL
jgi:hypothetical protein